MLLLDSHVVLWVLDDSPRLGPSARERIGAAPAVHVSAASILELTIKAMLGRLAMPAELVQTLRDDGYDLLALTAEDAQAVATVQDLARHDLFDRMLLAQASGRGLTLMTADRVLLGLSPRLPAGILADATD